ncbi:MAG: hypothetical protein N3F10_01595 [Candidatus Bathyarchaeota archaeon]|nr:hypothetical protein [Candidatus Bathyarchaeota archaeon]
MAVRTALVTIELLDESREISRDALKQELKRWFKENIQLIPWAKKLKDIKIKEETLKSQDA